MSKLTEDPLFPPGRSHIEVRCWSCGHSVEMQPDRLPAGISQHDFERRAKVSMRGQLSACLAVSEGKAHLVAAFTKGGKRKFAGCRLNFGRSVLQALTKYQRAGRLFVGPPGRLTIWIDVASARTFLTACRMNSHHPAKLAVASLGLWHGHWCE